MKTKFINLCSEFKGVYNYTKDLKMKRVNLFEFHNLFMSQAVEKDKIQLYLEFNELKPHELETLNKLCEILKSIYGYKNPHIFENYYIGYKIAQIGKEFDILRIGENRVVNIELKSQKDESKILKQLQKNYYYLSFLDRKIHCFTFVVGDTCEFYRYDKTSEKLEPSTAENIVEILRDFNDSKENIDDLFVPSNYLISPFNDTEKFLSNEYFLTIDQERIKNEILKDIENNSAKIFSIAGQAGTGKTLLAYDIAKTLIKKGHKTTIVHCAKSNQGIDKLKSNAWDIWDINTICDLKEKMTADIFIFDETQRLTTSQIQTAIKSNKILIFCHDVRQGLNKRDRVENVVELIEKSANKHYQISTKIRHNENLASFIKKFFNLKSIKSNNIKENDYKDISFYYAADIEDAKTYISYCVENGWEYIYLTAFDGESLNSFRFNSTQSSHQVIGQEFDNVVVVITPDFYYNDDNKLSYKSTSYYNPLETLFQAVSRTRKRLKFVIINNLEVYKTCIEIISKRVDGITND